MKKLLALILCLWVTGLSGQEASIEKLRQKGYEAKVEGNSALSIEYYGAILEQSPNDYDATLALARLFTFEGDYEKAITFYQRLLEPDPKDWEALHGIGNCHLLMGNLSEAINYHRGAVDVLPDYVPGYLALAMALSWNGDLDQAIAVYENANDQDPTYAEVWAGLGKMYNWKGQPFTASSFYRKATELDPSNALIQAEYNKIQLDNKPWLKGQFRLFQEKEQSYVIDAVIQQYTFSKRLSDRFHLQVNSLFDYSSRDFTQSDNDTMRWFINSWAKFSWIGEHHRIGLFTGYSPTDRLFSTYGLTWQMKYQLGKLDISNTLNAGYEYFFYWNNVGRKAIKESLQLQWKRWELNLGLSLGLVDEKPTYRYKGQDFELGTNPFWVYNLSLYYKVLKNPIAKIGIQHSFMDFDYQSIDYYSPYDRKLSGFGTSVQKKFEHWYFYSSVNYNIGSERFYFLSDRPGVLYETGTVDVNNWSAGLEIGYTIPTLSVSIGGSRFKNPFYENWIGFLSISKSL
jgi:tetratricopeptide (TPR) repeat protein